MTAPAEQPQTRWRHGAGTLGRLLVYASMVLVATVAYLMFGTASIEAKAQRQLRAEFAAHSQAARSQTTSPPSASANPSGGRAPTTTPAPTTGELAPAGTTSAPAIGRPVARVVIPAIGVDRIVVEGVGTAELRTGPGHYPGTPQPGEAGNVAIAGHRTTYGAPFGDLDRLQPSDRITLHTVDGRVFTYEVISTEIVVPSDVRVLADQGDHRVTLTACHPKRSARRRIVVSARLVVQEQAASRAARTQATRSVPASVGSAAVAVSEVTGGSELAGSSAPGGATAPWWWAWLGLGALANEARHWCGRWLRPRGRAWRLAGPAALTVVVAGATWRAVVIAADLIQWNL